MRFLIEIIVILKTINSHFNESYVKQNLTLVVISYDVGWLLFGAKRPFEILLIKFSVFIGPPFRERDKEKRND